MPRYISCHTDNKGGPRTRSAAPLSPLCPGGSMFLLTALTQRDLSGGLCARVARRGLGREQCVAPGTEAQGNLDLDMELRARRRLRHRIRAEQDKESEGTKQRRCQQPLLCASALTLRDDPSHHDHRDPEQRRDSCHRFASLYEMDPAKRLASFRPPAAPG